MYVETVTPNPSNHRMRKVQPFLNLSRDVHVLLTYYSFQTVYWPFATFFFFGG